ncbi:helix-turn-helix transcriptional regulator [Thermomonospora amylolytica]|uniref:helix-turn-helix transcriptional regulator n=1 Tax=Thermomonospora amylolytica TaxID=1411117 RepID=UPI000E6C6111|nr:YafY family protein [Thermomonospora amylolytica]
MANTSGRMLRLLSLLQTHRYWPGAELAERLGVSERTLRRDIDRLRELGYPVDAGRGVGGGYQLRSGAAMPPLQLDDEEAVAIAVGLRSAAAGAVGGDGDGVAEISVRALAKIVQVMPPRLRRRVEALQDITVPAMGRMPRLDAAALAVLAQCCRDGERVRFSYTARDGASTDRTVEPHRLVAQDRRWYLVAYDLERQDWRTFRVDRLSRPEPTGARFRHREIPGGDAAALVRPQTTARSFRYQVVVDVRTKADAFREIVGRWGTVEETGSDSCRWTIGVDGLEWPVMVLAVANADFTVCSPPELTDRIRTTATRFTRATR